MANSFVGTYMEENADRLMFENIAKNLADSDEYPALMNIHSRCISIIAHLWGVQSGERAIGSATTGSSEAIHLGGLAMKRRWQEKRMAEGKDVLRPNIIMGANAQVALEKFARYFEVEARILPVSEKSHFRLDPELVRANIDENTIGVFVILGSTFTGHYEPVEEISQILDDYEAKTGIDIPIHVDAASGGFVAPFTHAQAGGSKWLVHLLYSLSPSSLIEAGTSNSLVLSPSILLAINSALSMLALAGSFGVMKVFFPNTLFSSCTTLAAPKSHTRSISPGQGPMSSANTIT
jgi:glutamate decarboxylase